MQELKETILKKYQRATKKFIKNELLKKGYIKTPGNKILKLDPFNYCFIVVDIESIINLINNYVSNFWNIAPETQKDIITNNLIELLPMATEQETEQYINYYNASKNIKNEKELNNNVKALLNQNKKNIKPVFKGGANAPEYQSQALINNNVFYCNQNYYKFDDKEKEFIKLNANDILKYVKSSFENVNIDKLDIMDYMKASYLFFVINTDLPIIYNNNKSKLKTMEHNKTSYEKINKIVSTFE